MKFYENCGIYVNRIHMHFSAQILDNPTLILTWGNLKYTKLLDTVDAFSTAAAIEGESKRILLVLKLYFYVHSFQHLHPD